MVDISYFREIFRVLILGKLVQMKVYDVIRIMKGRHDASSAWTCKL
jgi:hypothetical protein